MNPILAGILGYQDGLYQKEIEEINKKIERQNQVVKCENFKQIEEKFKEYDTIITTLTKQVRALMILNEMNGINMNDLINQIDIIDTKIITDNKKAADEKLLNEIINVPETLQLEMFKCNINNNGHVMYWGKMEDYRQMPNILNEIANKYRISWKFYYDKTTKKVIKSMTFIKKRNGQDVASNELNESILPCSYMFTTCMRQEYAKFTNRNTNITLKDLLEILNRINIINFNEKLHQNDIDIDQLINKFQNIEFGGVHNKIISINTKDIDIYPMSIIWNDANNDA